MKLAFKICFLFLLAISYSGFLSCQQLPKQNKTESVEPVLTEGELEFADLVDSRSITDRLKFVTKLPVEVNECSGLEFIHGDLWTLNDSGSPSTLYQIDKADDKLVHQIAVQPAVNTDWEELTASEDQLFIGNFGNNYGMRKDLAVYVVSLEHINQQTTSAETVATIEFEFEDQTEFRHINNKHNFDCEAMVSFNNQLYLFSKNRGDNQCSIYALDLENSDVKQTAKSIATFDTKGQVTAADYDEETGVLALLGYVYKPADGSMHPFIYLFYDFPDHNFFSGQHKRFDLGIQDQAEGLSFIDNNMLLIACEAESGGQGNLFQFDISGLIQ